jgi:uncharacterized protein YecE (DUF72 family)
VQDLATGHCSCGALFSPRSELVSERFAPSRGARLFGCSFRALCRAVLKTLAREPVFAAEEERMRVYIGAEKLLGKIETYAKRFEFLEVHCDETWVPAAVDASGPSKIARAHGPTSATLRKWRRALPPGFVFGVIPPKIVRELDATVPGFDDAMRHTLETMKTVQAACFVLRTPASVRPHAALRNKLLALRAKMPKDVVRFVWEPSGLIECAQARKIVHDTDIAIGVDPFLDDVASGPVAFLRMRALGERRSFSTSALASVLEKVLEARSNEVFCVFDSHSAHSDAQRLRGVAGELASLLSGRSEEEE